MRKSAVLTSLAALATTAGVAVAPVASAGGVGRLVMTGNIAQFDWRTCTDGERGVPCRRTVLIATDEIVHESNDHLDPAEHGELIRWGGPAVILRIWDYTVDPDTGRYVPLRESFGSVGLPGTEGAKGNPVVQIDTQLRSVRVRATDLRMDVHYPDRRVRTTASVALAASGSGPLRRISEGQMWWSLDGKWTLRATGWQRSATGLAIVDHAAVAGTLVAADLQHGRYVETTATKGPMRSLAELAAATSASTALPLRHFTDASGGAGWDSCPRAAVGERCRQVFISYDAIQTARGERRGTASLYASTLRVSGIYKGEKLYQPVTEVVASEVAADVTARSDLESVQVHAANANAEKCSYAADDVTCRNATIDFGASFSGAGPSARINQHAISWGGWGRELIHVRGETRAAAAGGSLNGRPFPRALTEASISYVRGFTK